MINNDSLQLVYLKQIEVNTSRTEGHTDTIAGCVGFFTFVFIVIIFIKVFF